MLDIADNIHLCLYGDAIKLQHKYPNSVFVNCSNDLTNIKYCLDHEWLKNMLYLNIIDKIELEDLDKQAINFFLTYYKENKDKDYFIFCNKGKSRSPTLALLCLLINKDKRIDTKDIEHVIYSFKELYPDYNPYFGMYHYLKDFYNGEINGN